MPSEPGSFGHSSESRAITVPRLVLIASLVAQIAPVPVQQEVKITDVQALDAALDIHKHKAVPGALLAQGFSEEEVNVVLQAGDIQDWPPGIRTQVARDTNAPYI